MYRWITRLPKPIAMAYCYFGSFTMFPIVLIEPALTKLKYKTEFKKYWRVLRTFPKEYDYWKKLYEDREK